MMDLFLDHLTPIIGAIATIGSIYRFLIYPILKDLRDKQRETENWRACTDTRLDFLEGTVELDPVVQKIRNEVLKRCD